MKNKITNFKYYILSLFIMIGIVDVMSQDKYVDSQNIDSIVIKYHAVDWDYPVRTVKSRFTFDKRFEQGDWAGIKILKKKKKILYFVELINSQKPLPPEEIKIYPNDADEYDDPLEVVFSKIEIYYHNKTTILWVNRFYMDIDNYRYYISPKIRDIIYAIPYKLPDWFPQKKKRE